MSERAGDREYGNFTMNYMDASGRWRGVIKVPVRDAEGKVRAWVSRRYIGVGPKLADSGTEYISLYVRSADPMVAARERSISVDLAVNKPASYTARAVNRGTLFLPTEERLRKAEADGKSLPAAQGYLLMMIEGKPTYVEVGSWPRTRKPKSAQVADVKAPLLEGTEGEAEIDFYSGPAEIHDPAVALARKIAKQRDQDGEAATEHADLTPAGFVDGAHDIDQSLSEMDAGAEAGPKLAPETAGPVRRRKAGAEPAA
jgi:hypothetical protein